MSLTEIDDAAALRILETDSLLHLAEISQLERNRPPFPRETFGDTVSSHLLLMVTDSPRGPGGLNFCLSRSSSLFLS